jgi:CPA2 family monovalent cation:H+ antiporter-2
MHGSHAFLLNLAMIFSVAAVVTVLFHRLRLPVVLGYLLAGMLVGPHVPVPLVADASVVHSLSELGLVLLMFAIGLEFELRKLWSVAPTGGLVAMGEISFVAWLGFQAAQLLGWSTSESLFCGAMVAISSTSIIAKAFEERGVKGRWREVVFGVLVVEDVVAILMLVALGLFAGGRAVEPHAMGLELVRLGVSLVLLLTAGLLIVPRFFRYVVDTGRREMLVVASVGLGFGVALLTQQLGYSVALGAFLAGTMVAESGHGHKVFEAVQPVRDVFAALFFVAVGMLIDPSLLLPNAGAILLLVWVVWFGKLLGVGLGAFLLGNGLRTSVQAGMSMTQIGEFSFVIATLGVSSGAIREALYPTAVVVSVITTFTTPLAIRAADPLALWLDHKMPHRLQIWTSLYTAWIEQVRHAQATSALRNLALALAGDVLAFGLLAAIYGLLGDIGARWVSETLDMWPLAGMVFVGSVFGVLAAPLGLGIVRLSGALATELLAPVAGRLVVETPGLLLALSAGVRLAITLLAGLVALALAMPWLPAWPLVVIFLAGEAFLVALLWRSAATMQGEITPGATVIARAILQGTASGGREEGAPKGAGGRVQLLPGSYAVGRSLVELDVRARTGASIVAVELPGQPPQPPNGKEPLPAGATLTLVGPEPSRLAAHELLRLGSLPSEGHAAV